MGAANTSGGPGSHGLAGPGELGRPLHHLDGRPAGPGPGARGSVQGGRADVGVPVRPALNVGHHRQTVSVSASPRPHRWRTPGRARQPPRLPPRARGVPETGHWSSAPDGGHHGLGGRVIRKHGGSLQVQMFAGRDPTRDASDGKGGVERCPLPRATWTDAPPASRSAPTSPSTARPLTPLADRRVAGRPRVCCTVWRPAKGN